MAVVQNIDNRKDKGSNNKPSEPININAQWEKRLTRYETSGKVQCTIDNFVLILRNHQAFKNKIQKNLLSQYIEIIKKRTILYY